MTFRYTAHGRLFGLKVIDPKVRKPYQFYSTEAQKMYIINILLHTLLNVHQQTTIVTTYCHQVHQGSIVHTVDPQER